MTMEALISGLQNQNLRIPTEHLENVRRFTMTGTESGKNRDDIPFDRYVDVWWNALCIGIQEGRRTKVDPKNWHNFVRAGEVLPSNLWRVFQLQMMAIGETGRYRHFCRNPASSSVWLTSTPPRACRCC